MEKQSPAPNLLADLGPLISHLHYFKRQTSNTRRWPSWNSVLNTISRWEKNLKRTCGKKSLLWLGKYGSWMGHVLQIVFLYAGEATNKCNGPCCAVLELLLTGTSLRTHGRNEGLRLKYTKTQNQNIWFKYKNIKIHKVCICTEWKWQIKCKGL